MHDDAAAILMHMGHDFRAIAGSAPNAHFRLDSHGWLGLSGERDCADLNMATVVHGAPRALVDDYVAEIRSRDLSAILFIDARAEGLSTAASEMGLTPAGSVPVMYRQAAPIVPIARPFTVRRAVRADVAAANDLMAEAFSLDRSAIQRVLPPSYLGDTVETWLVEDAGVPVGCGTFIRTGDSVGIYSMSTPARHQGRGIGRAVLEHAMKHYQTQGVAAFTLEATAQGLHLYEQVGFRTVMEAPVFVIGQSTQFPGRD